MAASLLNPPARVVADDDDDRPLTPEEIAEAKREWIEANERVAKMRATAPSFTVTNGEDTNQPPVNGHDKRAFADRESTGRPSFATANGG
ncbi:MAG: hypothetical protein WCL32_09180 [Planctomycetota bacterium]